jgi:hypothetical protein
MTVLEIAAKVSFCLIVLICIVAAGAMVLLGIDEVRKEDEDDWC